MLYVRLIVGIAFLLMAALGPGTGVRPRSGSAQANDDPSRMEKRDEKMATVMILRILAALIGLGLLFSTFIQFLLRHGHI